MYKILIFILIAACVDPSGTKNKQNVVSTMAQTLTMKFKDVPQLPISKFLELKKDDFILVDVRTPSEYQVSMIPGAITKEEFEKNKDKYGSKHIILYCTIGYRSSDYARELIGKGFKASNLKESALGWAHHGQMFTHKGKSTKKVHVYSDAWNLLPEGYEAISD